MKTMHTPPANQGQTVVVSYGWHDGCLYRHTLDRSDRSERWEVANDDDALADYQESSSEIWNEAPSESLTWRPAREPRDLDD